MHFHLPKPLHGWRQFVGEVGIIVVGVLVALGAEQVVESMHWHHEADRSIDALKVEIAAHFVNGSEAMIAAPCIDRQLQLLELRLVRPGPFQPAPLFHEPSVEYTVRAPNRLWSDDVWRSVVSEGIPSHFSPDLRQSLSTYYSQVATIRDNNGESYTLSNRLRVLAQPIQPDASTRARLIEEIEEARGRHRFAALVSSQSLYQIRQLHFQPSRAELEKGLADSGTLKFCRAHRLPLGNNTSVF
jgi:hypothetical protein